MTILCYHAVDPVWSSPLAMPPAAFAGHCAWLARHRAVLPLERAVERLDRSARLPRGTAALTFDDGFSDLHEHALPLLVRYRLPATVFIVAATLTPAGKEVDWVDTPPAHPLTTLRLDQVLEMQAAGVTFASHTWAHRDLTRMGFTEAVTDLRRSREHLEDLLHRPVTMLAYPRGRHDAQVRDAVRRAGYTHAFTLPEGPEPVGPLAVPRVGIHHGNGLRTLRVKAARPYVRLRTGPAYRVADRVRARAKVG